ncbi:galectin-related protein-like isoform X1 [Lethenteron reissneri]|uniref:galectin-related protein-like isoform X1 n=1 Tax=Lethenteron reissneri TaxID=7753 RepID=UPI002AB6D587|nr:galectin-related protein-like isoform X1 [Lethenteron reissneri]
MANNRRRDLGNLHRSNCRAGRSHRPGDLSLSENHDNKEHSASILAVPFSGNIKNGLRVGMKITIMGIVDKNPDSFTVSLTCGDWTTADVAFNMAALFGPRAILRNTMLSGSWGKEESTLPYFPFTLDQPFRLEIACEHQRFKVSIDGHLIFDFCHRVQSVSLINTLKIKGSVTITKIC